MNTNPRAILQALGLHPLAAFALFAVDWMLFGEEAATLGLGAALSIPAGLALGFGAIMLQRFSYKDDWGTAIGKGVVMGVLTAIPTPLPGILNVVGGGLGVAHLLLPNLQQATSGEPASAVRQIVEAIPVEKPDAEDDAPKA